MIVGKHGKVKQMFEAVGGILWSWKVEKTSWKGGEGVGPQLEGIGAYWKLSLLMFWDNPTYPSEPDLHGIKSSTSKVMYYMKWWNYKIGSFIASDLVFLLVTDKTT